MSAPLPLRFHNPVKDLATKYHLNYETLVGEMKVNRDCFINAEIEKKQEDVIKGIPSNMEERQMIKHKKQFYEKKYGATLTSNAEGGEAEDKGMDRYKQGLIVEHIWDDFSTYISSTVSPSSNGVNKTREIAPTRTTVWSPGRPNKS